MNVVDVCAIITAGSLLLLAAAAIACLLGIRVAATRLSRESEEFKQRFNPVMYEVERLLQSAQRLTDDAAAKLAAIDPFLEAVKQAGETVQDVTSTVQQTASSVTRSLTEKLDRAVRKQEARLAEAADWGVLAAGIWRQLHSLRKAMKPAAPTHPAGGQAASPPSAAADAAKPRRPLR